MTIARHLTHAVGSTGSAIPAYRVDVRGRLGEDGRRTSQPRQMA
jgi:hypothetical protein